MTAHEPAAAFRTDATAAASATLLLPAGPVTATRRESDASSTFPSLAARRPHRPVRRAGRAGERGGRRRLRLLVAGHVHPEIHPTIVWAKFEAPAEGARRATARLW